MIRESPRERRILKDQNAALGFVGRYEAAGFYQEGTEFLVMPDRRNARTAWFGCYQAGQHFPERRRGFPTQPFVELTALLADIGLSILRGRLNITSGLCGVGYNISALGMPRFLKRCLRATRWSQIATA